MRLLRRSAFLGRSSPKVVAAGTPRPGPGPACTRFCCARAGCIGAGRLIAPSRVPCSWGRQSSSCPCLLDFGAGASSPVLTPERVARPRPPTCALHACVCVRTCLHLCMLASHCCGPAVGRRFRPQIPVRLCVACSLARPLVAGLLSVGRDSGTQLVVDPSVAHPPS